MTALLLACLSLPAAPLGERKASDFENTMWEYIYIDEEGKPRGISPDGKRGRKWQFEFKADKTCKEYFWTGDEENGWRVGVEDGTWEFKDHTLFIHYRRSHDPAERFRFSGLSSRVRHEVGEQKYLVNMRKIKSLDKAK